MHYKSLLVVGTAFLMACGTSKNTPSQEKTLNEIVVTTGSAEMKTTQSLPWDILHTDISLQPFQQVNDSFLKEAKGEVVIRLHPFCYATDSLVLDAKAMEVHEVKLLAPSQHAVAFKVEADKLICHFSKTYHHYDTLTIQIKYTAKPYSKSVGGSKAISEDRGLYYINNNYEVPGKPKQIWTQGETEANSHWFPTQDQPNEKFTFSLQLMVPDSMVTLSNGEKVSSQKTAVGWRVDKWEMKQPIQPYAVMFSIGKFSIVEDSSWKGKPIQYYVEPEYAPYARSMFKNTPDMIDFFSKITGVDYPWNKYSQIVVRDYVSGAMENTSASLFGEFVNKNHREIADNDNEGIVAHELFHQWFGDYVTAESWGMLTLNESFATYGEMLWVHHHEGRVAGDALAQNNLFSYLGQSQFSDAPLVRFYYNSREDMFDRITYQKGSVILRYLHGLMGDSAFYKAMNIYLTSNAFGTAEVSDWRKAVEKATGKDWRAFFNQWYYQEGYPELALEFVPHDSLQQLEVKVKQDSSKSMYLLPLQAALVYDTGVAAIDWNIQQLQSSFFYPYHNGQAPLFIPDSKRWLVGVILYKQTPKEWWRCYRALKDDFIGKRRCIDGISERTNDSFSIEIMRMALNEPYPEIKNYMLSCLQKVAFSDVGKENLLDEVGYIAAHDHHNLVRAEAIKVLGKWKNSRFKQELLTAVNDSSYAVSGAALIALKAIDSTLANQQAQLLARQNNLKGAQQQAVWELLSQSYDTSIIHYWQQQSIAAYGRNKIALAATLKTYALNSQDERVFEQTLQLIYQMATSENIKNYRYSIGSMLLDLYNILDKTPNDVSVKVTTIKAAKIKTALRYKELLISTEEDKGLLESYKAY